MLCSFICLQEFAFFQDMDRNMVKECGGKACHAHPVDDALHRTPAMAASEHAAFGWFPGLLYWSTICDGSL
jgi:hypothetical protein